MGLPALTDRQRALLDHLASFVAKRGYAPSLQEIAHAFGFSSLQGVKDHLKALERKGYVRRSEEHTSELQSRLHLVCRLLLEKKKKATGQSERDCRDAKCDSKRDCGHSAVDFTPE